ncbi:MAG: DUF1109 family protein [Thermoanaerobaculia bacterium]|nr:DUF1109 family protein [Thermoanaerobaculia bacterium]
MSGTPLPPALRAAVASDLRPVRPLASPARRALALLAWAPLAAAFVLALRGLRPDAAELGLLLTWGVVLAEVSAGAGLVALALAEAVPARGPGRPAALLALGGAAALFVALAAATRRASRGMEVDDPLVSFGPACAGMQGLIGLTAFAVAALLVLRAAPMRARLAGLLAGAGTGFLAEGVYHLDCPITHLSHVLVWHGSAILLLALLGLAFGVGLGARERARMERRRAAAAAREGGVP